MDAIIRDILDQVAAPETREYVRHLLLEICAIDTTPYADVTRMRDAEAAVFGILERELDAVSLPGARRERRPVNPAIASHPAFSLLHFTKTEECPEGLPPEEVYAERVNLLHFVPGKDGYEGPDGIGMNAHIDVVKPFIPPRDGGDVLYGRGTCDDKGATVAMVAALRILAKALANADAHLARNLVSMFVIEEETGGNGSLSLALDRELRQLYGSLIVLECTGNNLHPANRGAVWYKAALACPDANLFEMSAYVIEQMEQEGRALKAESRHPLFPQRPVQTCHGMIGHYGEHPSRICGEVAFDIQLGTTPDQKTMDCITDCIEAALAEYVAVYGDKTQAIDQTTGKPKVDHHYDLTPTDGGFRCAVHGSTGHMGSILENDGAITKMAAFVRALVRSRTRIEAMLGDTMALALADEPASESLVLEGGQGFVPTHPIEEVMDRVATAARRGAENYLRIMARNADAATVTVTYEKLHNAAFDGDPNSSAMQAAIAAAKDSGIWQDQEVMGWTVSCDARLFAAEYPDLPIVTSGAGLLQYAHGDQEQIRLDDLVASIGFLAIYLLKQAGIA
jgi:acetylornithine deacetylase/succinyl-diaminopimelate desuccinylase-like protein